MSEVKLVVALSYLCYFSLFLQFTLLLYSTIDVSMPLVTSNLRQGSFHYVYLINKGFCLHF